MSLSDGNKKRNGVQDDPNHHFQPSPISPVTITEYPHHASNPTPLGDLDKAMIEDYISHDKLKAVSGKTKLCDITAICLQVNTREASIGNIGELLLNLEQLKLTNSYISSIRDLGSSLSKLTLLSIAGCGVDDLEGVTMIPTLKELYVAYNNVSDLSPLSLMDELQVLDLEGNNVEDISQVEFLSLCGNLRTLVLEGNPVQLAPQPNVKAVDLEYYHYLSVIPSLLPLLKYLDNRPITSASADDASNSSNLCDNDRTQSSLDNVCQLVQDSIKLSQKDDIINQKVPLVKDRINRPMTVHDLRRRSRPLTATTGGVFCGNAGRALRQRAKNSKQTVCHSQSEKVASDLESERLDLFDELRQWKAQYECKKPVPIHTTSPTPPSSKRPIRPHTASVLGRRAPLLQSTHDQCANDDT